jgi:hypothetical protein
VRIDGSRPAGEKHKILSEKQAIRKRDGVVAQVVRVLA